MPSERPLRSTRRATAAASALAAVLALAACGGEKAAEPDPAPTPAAAPSEPAPAPEPAPVPEEPAPAPEPPPAADASEPAPAPAESTPGSEPTETTVAPTTTTYPLTIENCGATITVPARPERVLGDQEQDTVPLFELGAGDRVVAVFTHISGDLEFIGVEPAIIDAIRALPGLSPPDSGYPSFEKVIAQQADFIFQAYPGDAIGGDPKNQDALDATGIPVYTQTANCENPDADGFEAHFRDLESLGTILDVQDRAAELVATRREQLAEIERRVAGLDRPRAFLLDSFDEESGAVWTNTGPFARDTIERAGATPVPEPGPDRYVASKEAIAAADVEVLLVTHYIGEAAKLAGTDEERAERFFEAFPNAPASKARRWVAVPYPGGPNAVLIAQRVAEALHPDAFAG